MEQATANLVYTKRQKELDKIHRIVAREYDFWVDAQGKVWHHKMNGYYMWAEGPFLVENQIEVFVRDDIVYMFEDDLQKFFKNFDFSNKCPFTNIRPVFVRKQKGKSALLGALEMEKENGPSSRNA